MNWFTQVFFQLVRQVKFWIVIGLSLLVIIGLGFYHNQSDQSTFTDMQQYVIEEQSYIHNINNYIRLRKTFDPSYDQSQQYEQLQREKMDLLLNWQEILRQNGTDLAETILAYNQLLVEEAQIDYKMAGIDLQSVQDQLAKASYLSQHNYPYINEEKTWNNGFFMLKVSEWLFSIITTFLLLLIFGFTIYRDVSEQKLSYYYTLPIRRNFITWKYSFQLLQVSLAIIATFLTSLIPLILTKNLWTLNYPYVVTKTSYSITYPLWQVIGLRILIWLTGLLFLHLISLILLLICHSVETNIVLTLLTILLLFYLSLTSNFNLANPGTMWFYFTDFIYLTNALGVVFSFFLTFIITLVFLHYSGYVAQANQWLTNKSKTIHKKQNPMISFLPAWLKFERDKRFAFKGTSRMLILLGTICIFAYTYSFVRTKQMEEIFQHNLQQDLIQAESDLMAANIMRLDALSQTMYGFKDDFDNRENQSQSYLGWLSDNHPDLYQAINRNESSFETYYQLLKDQVEASNLSSADLIHFRESYYDYYTQNINPFVQGTIDSSILGEKYLLAGQKENQWIKDNQLTAIYEAIGLAHFNDTALSPIHAERVSDTFLFSLYYWIQRLLPIIIMLCIILCVISTLSDEWDGTKAFNWLLTLPMNPKHMFKHKLIYNFTIFITICMIILIAHTLISWLVGGFGEFNYPVLVYDSHRLGNQPDYQGYYASVDKLYFHFIPLGIYLLQALVLFINGGIFIVSLITSLSTLFKRRLLAIGISVAVLLIGYFISFEIIDKSFNAYLPFLFLNIRDTLDGWWNHLANTNSYNVGIGVVVLLSWSVLINLLGYGTWCLRLKKRGG